MGSYEVSPVSLCHSMLLPSTEGGLGFFSMGSPFSEPCFSHMLILLKMMACLCATSWMKSAQPSGWLGPVQTKGKLWARGTSVGPEVSCHSALQILLHLASWCPAVFWRWKVSGQRNRDRVFGVVHIRCKGLKSQQSCLSTDQARAKPICAPSIQFLTLQGYSLINQLSYFSARQQPSASGASSNSGAVRNFQT